MNKEPFLGHTLGSRAFQRIYDKRILDEYSDRMRCPANDKLCQEGVWFTQTMLLGSSGDMDQIAEAVRKVHTHSAALA